MILSEQKWSFKSRFVKLNQIRKKEVKKLIKNLAVVKKGRK